MLLSFTQYIYVNSCCLFGFFFDLYLISSVFVQLGCKNSWTQPYTSGCISAGKIWSISEFCGSGAESPPPWPYTSAGPKPACTEIHFAAAKGR